MSKKIILQKNGLLLLLLLTANILFAQQLRVSYFEMEENDLRASVTHVKMDNNNKKCNIIVLKTALPYEDFFFENIVTSERVDGEIWIYVPVNARWISIKNKYYLKVDYTYPQPLLEGKVYEMTLVPEVIAEDGRKTIIDVPMQYFVLNCDVEGATVQIDNNPPVPILDGRFETRLSFGPHKYTVEADLYHPKSGKVDLNSGQKPPPVTITLAPKFGRLTIKSIPEDDGIVFLDGVKLGNTPYTIEKMGSGKHNVKVMKDLYLPSFEDITIYDGMDTTLTIELPPNFADVTLKADGDIYIDDRKVGTNDWKGRLQTGLHKIEVLKKSYQPVVTPIDVKAGEAINKELDKPKPIFGYLDINANVEASVYIDGQLQNEKTPCVLYDVLIGERSIELVADGYEPYRGSINIEEKKTQQMKGVLKIQSKTGSIYITSNTMATVSIDGVKKGTTPLTLTDQIPGEKEVELSATGYKTTKQTITVSTGKNDINIPLIAKKITPVTTFISYNFSTTAYYGFWLGFCKRAGAYGQFRTGTLFPNKVTMNYNPSSYNYVNYDDKAYVRMSATAGFMLKFASFLYGYVGAGYGHYAVAYKLEGNANYTYYSPYLTRGIEAEGGIMLKLSVISASVGYSTIFQDFKTTGFGELGFRLGVAF